MGAHTGHGLCILVQTTVCPAVPAMSPVVQAFEDACYVYVGASGAVFGFLGLYLADIVLNFESMYRPVLRLALMLVSLGLTLGIEFATARASPLL